MHLSVLNNELEKIILKRMQNQFRKELTLWYDDRKIDDKLRLQTSEQKGELRCMWIMGGQCTQPNPYKFKIMFE